MKLKPISKYFGVPSEISCDVVPVEAGTLFITDEDFPVYLKDGVIDTTLCDELVTTILDREGFTADVLGGELTDKIRITRQYELSTEEKELFSHVFEREKPSVERFFSRRILQGEGFHGLGYPPGGHYIKHADNCFPVRDSEGNLIRFECNRPKRQISAVLFLTESVTEITGPNQCFGGNISFPHIVNIQGEPLIVEPRKGMLLMFPSNPYFIHQVHEVYDGFRLSIVNWYDALPL